MKVIVIQAKNTQKRIVSYEVIIEGKAKMLKLIKIIIPINPDSFLVNSDFLC